MSHTGPCASCATCDGCIRWELGINDATAIEFVQRVGTRGCGSSIDAAPIGTDYGKLREAGHNEGRF